MLVKGVAVVIILFSTGMMGLILAKSFSNQVHNLRQLITLMQVFESEISFAQNTLPQVIKAQTTRFSGNIARFLDLLNQKLNEGSGERFIEIWDEALAILASSGLSKTTLEDLHNLGNILGTSDLHEQIKHLNILLHRLNEALRVAEKEQQKQTRLWRYLGFSTGILLILLLI